MLPPPIHHRSVKCNITLSGTLAPVIPIRYGEFFYRSFSPFGLELICFDMRINTPHLVTEPYARDPQHVQDAIDRDIACHYRPGAPRNKETIMAALTRSQTVAAKARLEPIVAIPESGCVSQRFHVAIPEILMPAVEKRITVLGFTSLSAYLQSLVRYDMLIGGPHLYFNGKHKDPELLAALNLRTSRIASEGKRQKILLEYMIEEASGKKMTFEELDKVKQQLCAVYREGALARDRERKRAGSKATT